MFNVSPYYDDFDPTKGFKRILFRPNVPVQARELNQTQSIMLNELNALSNHIFKNGSKVSNCRTGMFKRDYVRLMPLTTQGNQLVKPEGEVTLVGVVSGITAKLVTYNDATSSDPHTIYVVYTSSGQDKDGNQGEQNTFIHGEDINVFSNSVLSYTWTVRCPTCDGSTLAPEVSPTGKGYFYSIDEGIIYYNGYYVNVPQQEIVIEKYINVNENGFDVSDNEYKIGLDFITDIVTVHTDPTLYDNSAGTPNSGAEGADRYRVRLELVKRELDVNDGDNFVLLSRVGKNFTVTHSKQDVEYSVIMKEMAKRTYDQAGNFTVAPYTCTFYQSKKQNEMDAIGWELAGRDTHLVAVVEQGVAYVSGNRVSGDGTIAIEFEKARDTKTLQNYSSYLDYSQYCTVTVLSSNPLVNQLNDGKVASLTDVILYSDVMDVSGNTTGTQIGFAQVVDQYFFDTTTTQLVFSNIVITDSTKTFQDVRSIKTLSNTFTSNVVLVNGRAVLSNNDKKTLVYPVQQLNVSTLRSAIDATVGNTTITTRRKFQGTANSSGNVQFTVASNESFAGFSTTTDVAVVNESRVSVLPNQITVVNNQLTLALGSGNANAVVTFVTNVVTRQQTEKLKTYTLHTYTTTSSPNGALGSIVPLTKADALELMSVRLVNPGDTNFEPIDVTSEYTLSTGQTPFYYTESFITRNVARSNIQSSWRLEVSFAYFEHSGSAPAFTVDSYREAINDGLVKYETLPRVNVNGVDYSVSDVIDFRPIAISGSIVGNVKLPTMGSTAVFDVSYYLPRIDIVQISKDNVITVKKGVSSEQPVPPEVDIDNMLLYTINMLAYVYSLNDVRTTFVDNKRYTMKDINGIEKRLTNLEYYTALTLLEQKTLDTPIYDSIGVQRFKNGFLVDSFTNYNACDITSPNFKCAFDRMRGEMRPKFKTFSIPFKLNAAKSQNVKLLGDVAMLPYDEVEFMSNDYATKTVSINPYLIYNKQGSVLLSPNVDVWSDDTNLPTVVSTIDSGTDALRKVANASDLLGTDWASWVDLNTTTQRSSSTVVSNGNNVTTSVITTNTQQQRVGTSTTLESRIDTYSVEDVVKDVKIVPYIRSKVIDFYCSNLRPNTRVYVFFDGVNVTEHTRMKRPVGNDLLAARAFTLFGGAPLITDASGQLVGDFMIPANTFFTGEKSFVVSDTPVLTTEQTTSASTKYFAGGVTQTKQSSTLNIVSPVFKTSVVSENRTDTQRSTTVTSEPIPPVVVPPSRNIVVQNTTPVFFTPPLINPRFWTSMVWMRGDPVAQSFEVDEACFISRLGLYFSAVDLVTSDNIWVEIRSVVNGYPSTEVLTRKDYHPSQIVNSISSDSTKAFDVVFDIPVYVEPNRVYCFVVGGHSPDTRLWVSRLGEEVVNIKGKIVENPPSVHTSFRSLNGSTWTAEQFEFIKHKLYRCNFKTGSMSLHLESNFEHYVKLQTNPIEVQVGTNRVRVYTGDHGYSIGDKFNLSLYEGLTVQIEVTNNTPPQVGQRISTATGSATVATIRGLAQSNLYDITVTNIVGSIELDQAFNGTPLVKQFNTFVLVSNGNTEKLNVQVTECNGFIRSDITNTLGYSTIAGVSVSNFNKVHQVVEIDSSESVIVEMVGSFTSSGRFGGNSVYMFNGCMKFDTINVACEHLLYNSTHTCNLKTVGIDYNTLPDVSVKLNHDHNMSVPKKVASSVNETTAFGSARKSVELVVTANTSSLLLSPVYNLATAAASGVSNIVGSNNTAIYNVSPNATSRFVSEESADNGSSAYKYTTVPVSLNNAADNVRVYVEVYREPNADFDIYVRTRGTENEQLSEMTWLKLTNYDKSVFSSNVGDFIEYSIDSELSTGWLTREFTEYQVKIVSSSTNSSKPCIFRRLRIVAVT